MGARITDVVEDSPAEKGGLKVDDIVVQVDGEMIQSYSDFLAELRRRKKGDEVKLNVSRDREPVDLVLTLGKQPERRSRSNRRGRRQRNSEFTGTLGGQAANLQGQQGGENEEEFGGVYMSKDSGVSWERINTLNPRPMYYSQIRVDPSDNKNLYVLGTSLYRSSDGGETFESDGGSGIHPDNHAMWIDPKMGDHIILGNDGGIYVTFDRMDNWDHYNHIAIGQFYHVGLDATRDYKVYGGLQDNGSWGGPAQTRSGGPTNTDWFRVGGGDGFITLVDPNDKDQIYFESQNGAMGRNNLRTGDRGFIRPRAPRGTRYRFNWKTPFILSPHNSTMHYSAGNYVFRSFDKGNGIKAISPEITNTDRGAGSAISESPVTAGVIYVGTTDGAVWMTRDGGENWEEVFVQREASDEESEEGKSTSEAEPAKEKAAAAEVDEGTAETTEDDAVEATEEAAAERRPRGRRGRRGQRRSGNDPAATAEASSETKAPAEKPVDKTGDAEAAKAEAPEMDEKAKPDTAKESDDADAALAGLVGTWKGELELDQIPEDQRWVEMTIERDADGVISGEFETPRGVSTLSSFEFDGKTRSLLFTGANDNFDEVKFETEVGKEGKAITGQIDMGRLQVDFNVEKIDDRLSQIISTPVFQL
ncbi:MAG: PDZ domain-containing protein, partial [Pirellulaceae bacterium]|nr:PDZ domain-containing protein [Pirellulaceae bacterium]